MIKKRVINYNKYNKVIIILIRIFNSCTLRFASCLQVTFLLSDFLTIIIEIVENEIIEHYWWLKNEPRPAGGANWEFLRRKVEVSTKESSTFHPANSNGLFWPILRAFQTYLRYSKYILQYIAAQILAVTGWTASSTISVAPKSAGSVLVIIIPRQYFKDKLTMGTGT